jgi:hypothetical protein
LGNSSIRNGCRKSWTTAAFIVVIGVSPFLRVNLFLFSLLHRR